MRMGAYAMEFVVEREMCWEDGWRGRCVGRDIYIYILIFITAIAVYS